MVLKGVPMEMCIRDRGGLLGVQHTALFSVCVLYGVIDTDIPQVQTVLQNLISIGAAGSIGGISCHIVVGYGRFPLDLPFSGKGGIVDLNAALEIKRVLKVSYINCWMYSLSIQVAPRRTSISDASRSLGWAAVRASTLTA